jgi:hypothetical protein
MQVGELYPLFPTFGSFCEQARDFPHVLPHSFVAVLEGYYQVIGNEIFQLMTTYVDPVLPLYREIYYIGEQVQKSLYVTQGKPCALWDPLVAPICPYLYGGELCNYIRIIRNVLTIENIQGVYLFLSNAADKLLALKTEPLMKQPPRKPLREISPYIKLSSGAAEYIEKSTHMALSSVPNIVNTVKEASLGTPAVPFSRLSDIEKTVTYGEVSSSLSKVV